MTNIITGNESTMELMSKLSQGDYPAMQAIDGLMKLPPPGPMAILFLDVDNLDILGKKLGVLYERVCGRNIETMDSILGAWGMGGLGGATKEALHEAIAKAERHEPHGLDVDAIVGAYKAKMAA